MAFERRRDSMQSGTLSPSIISGTNHSGFHPVLTPSPSLSPESFEMSRGKVGLRTLNHPIDIHLEVIFVHSLMGDSSLTWTFDNDKAYFWPDWLTDDPEFRTVRIHTYGYTEPPVSGRAPVSKLRERGVALFVFDGCSDLELNMQLRSSANTPMVFVTHSLGGLVVKAAIESGKHNAKFQDLARRFHAVLFLATPHQDAEDRHMLRSLLRACNTSTARNESIEPDPNTAVLREINTAFLSCAQDMPIWSFYETGPDSVVDRKRGIIGTPKEIEVRVNAEYCGHAGVARFPNDSDPTYCNIKEILLALATGIDEDLRNPEKIERELSSLQNYLGLVDNVEDEELSRRERFRSPGSGEWLLAKDSFRNWRDKESSPNEKHSPVFWLTGDPGTGKSYLAARVISHLRERNHDATFFFFKRSDALKQGIGSLLKTIAWQMAHSSSNIRHVLMQMQQENTFTAEVNDSRAIWKQLFVHRIFRVEQEKDQYWVIDALDEAKNNQELFTLLQSLPERYSVFVTSRKDPKIERELRYLDLKVTAYQVEKQDTLQDIHLFFEQNEEDIHVDGKAEQQMFIKKLVDKSNGLFLWANLILKDLARYWDEDALDQVINDVPEGMNFLYDGSLKKITENVNGPLAKAILKWIICASRPMSVAELHTAIRLDMGKKLPKAAKAIENICSPLVTVDQDRVELVHDTLREYLVGSNRDRTPSSDIASDFIFDRGAAHENIAVTCLGCLSRSLRASHRRMSSDQALRDDEPFLAYASSNFSEHVHESAFADESASTRMLIDTLFEFFNEPILFWIQRLAERNSLSTLTHTGKNIKSYVDKRLKFPTHLEPMLQDLYGWADDLIHLVTAFGEYLIREPRIIHTVIPPLCPASSKIYSQLRDSEIGLQVVGFSQAAWPDQISSTSYGSRDYANALACCEKAYAVSLRSQQIVIYHATTCQEARRFPTAEAIKRLEFVHVKDWLVASGRKSLTMYNIETGEEVWTKPTTNEIFSLTIPSDGSSIITVTREKVVETFSVQKGERIDCRYLEQSRSQGRSPMQVHISHEMKLIAMIHRHEELELYDLDSLERPQRRISYKSNIETIAFNPQEKMLAMATFDGELSTVDLYRMRRHKGIEVDASHLAVSPNGEFLVVGTKDGNIQIHDFESLVLIHKIQYHEEEFMGLCFTSNSLRFLDIRRQVFNVWEPAALVRRDADDESSISGKTYATGFSTRGQVSISSDSTPITAITEYHTGDHIFVAKENGTVAIYESRTGRPKQKLFDTGRTFVSLLAWNEAQNLLACGDSSTNVKVFRVLFTQERNPGGAVKIVWSSKEVLKRTLTQPIRQIILSLDGEFLLVSTSTKEYVFRTNGGAPMLVSDNTQSLSIVEQAQKWATYYRTKHQFLEVHQGSQMIVWEKDNLRPRKEPFPVVEAILPESSKVRNRKNAYLVRVGTKFWSAHDNNQYTAPIVWPQSTTLQTEQAAARSAANTLREFDKIAVQVDSIIGLYRAKMIFISVDHWICSVRVDKPKFEEPVSRHFPMPHAWRTSNRPIQALVTCKGDLVFAVEGDLVVAKGGIVESRG